MVHPGGEDEVKGTTNMTIDSFTYLSYIEEVGANSGHLVIPNFKVPLSEFESLPVADRMSVAFANWHAFGAHLTVISILRDGYALEFDSKPPLVINPDPFYLHLSADQQVILDE